ncbi:hypothetical protein ACWPM1_04225 [Tsuneonella sp. HG249]
MHTPNLPAVIEALAAAPQPGQWTEFTRAQQVQFLEALAECGSVRQAARRVPIGASTVYRARRADPAFRTAWAGALIAARVLAEDTLATRAIEGLEEEVLYHGEVVATRRRYSDRLLLAHLGRLDRLTEDARAAAFAEDFEGALGRFAEGAGAPEKAPAETSPEQCANCAKSNSEPPSAAPPGERRGGAGEVPRHRRDAPARRMPAQPDGARAPRRGADAARAGRPLLRRGDRRRAARGVPGMRRSLVAGRPAGAAGRSGGMNFRPRGLAHGG